MKVLVLGAGGLLGNAVFRVFMEAPDIAVTGTVRSADVKRLFALEISERLVVAADLTDYAKLPRLFELAQPDVVINCVAAGKSARADLNALISVFAVFPQRLAHLCRLNGARLVQMSSDGVFSGSRGGYSEKDIPDARDDYGIAKLLGEVRDHDAITLRTSIIGHELQNGSGMLEWFLSQSGQCHGFTRAVFSGFPAVVLARLIRDVIVPRPELSGVYHVAANPITKFDLLTLIAKRYGKSIKLIPDDSVVVDRSLSAARFQAATGYSPPNWPELIDLMYSYNCELAKK